MNLTHILVVDDGPHIADSLADFLRHKAGYTVTTAGDGAEAMRILAGGTPAGPVDLVVLDSRMPEVSGTEVLAWLRQHPTLAFTRVIMLTATTGSQAKIDALSAGADDYVLKPYYPQEMLARINTILRTQQLEKQLQRQSQQLAALNQASNAVTTTLDMSQIPAAAVRVTASPTRPRAGRTRSDPLPWPTPARTPTAASSSSSPATPACSYRRCTHCSARPPTAR